MKTRLSAAKPALEKPLLELPDVAALSALRAWHEGLSSREAVARFIPGRRPTGDSSRCVIGHIRRQLAAFSASRQRGDLVRLFTGRAGKGAAATQRKIYLELLESPLQPTFHHEERNPP